MKCSVCQQETSPVTRSGQVCCSVCGTEYAVVPVVTRRRSMDLSPRKQAASNAPATPRITKTAAALHSRAKASQILDLRATKPEPKAESKTITKIVRPAHHAPAPPPKATIHQVDAAKASGRIEEARKHQRSPHINKFASSVVAAPAPAPKPPREPVAPVAPVFSAPTPQAPPAPQPLPAQQLPQLTATHHEAMARLAHPAPVEPPVKSTKAKALWPPRFTVSPRSSRVLATTTAVAIMAGYIWLNNYPKLAIQSANNKAGVAASLPGYIPSSYNLVSTDAIPGVVSLSYGSPSASESLKIAQTRTTWDSSSLLDNFVAKNTDDYATVQGQGLTIYLFNQNQATWVNHGIWYSIEGASRLSREQILKIAYSL